MSETLHHLLVAWFQFTLEWGYLGIIIMMAFESTAVPIPAEIVIPPAAYWAAQGKMDFWAVVLAATVGSYIGSAVSYLIAQKLGRPVVEKYGKYFFLKPDKLEMADRWFASYGPAGIFFARLLPVIRHLISLPAGLCRMDFKSFSVMTISGAGIFCALLAWFGKQVIGDQPELMNNPETLVHVLKSKLLWFVGAVVALGVLYALMKVMQNRSGKLAKLQ